MREMEAKKLTRPNSQDDKLRNKSKHLLKQDPNRSHPTKEIRRSVTPPVKFTFIPKLKSEATKTYVRPLKQDYVKNPSNCPFERDMENEELDEKLRLLEAKEKSIAEYYQKIKELNSKVLDLQKGCFYSEDIKIPRILKEEKDEILLNLEKNIYQISEIWLKTSFDLTNFLANIKNISFENTDEFQIENSKLQLAIKQAKSLTLIKTKNVIAEANKILAARDGILNGPSELETHVENRMSRDALPEEKKEEEESKSILTASIVPSPTKTFDGWTLSTLLSKVSSGDVTNNKKSAELARKNETITLLNNKIFEIQKACNEHLLENSQLQYKIAEMNERNNWNQAVWKQISKLKDRVKLLQQNNKLLEQQKKEIESKLLEMTTDLEKVTRLNHRLRQQINTWHEKPTIAAKAQAKKPEQGTEVHSAPAPPKNLPVLQEKENIIQELKNILVAMKGQEMFAHQKISEFETKIEEFKRYHN